MSFPITSPNTHVPEGLAPDPSQMATEETFSGWGVDDAEAALDEEPAPDAEDALDEEVEEEDEDTPSDEEEDDAPDEDEPEEDEPPDDTEEEGPENVEQYTDVGKSGKARIQALLAERKRFAEQNQVLNERLAAFERMAETMEAQRQLQEQAWEAAQRQRTEQERAQREAAEMARFQAMGYEPGNFSHELAIQTHRAMQEYIEQSNSQYGTVGQSVEQFQRERAAQMYLSQLDQHLEQQLGGLNATQEQRAFLRQTAIDLAQLHDTTPDHAVVLAMQRPQQLGVKPPARKQGKTKPKNLPPKNVVEAVAGGKNRSGRKPGPQTKAKRRKNGPKLEPEDEFLDPNGDRSGW